MELNTASSRKHYEIFNEDCNKTMDLMIRSKDKVDVILTSPFYNISEKAGKTRTLSNVNTNKNYYPYLKYDVHVDNMTEEEYEEFTINLFDKFDGILEENGVILYNISYGSKGMDSLIKLLGRVIGETPFSIADTITWKKPTAMPNNVSSNKLTRITEYVFVFCRKTEFKTFRANKEVVGERSTGQKMYGYVNNFIEARNNDGSTPLNKATFSTELCDKLLGMYAQPNSVVYDPFSGTGTTGVSSVRLGHKYLGSEISKGQVEYSERRIEEELTRITGKSLKRIKNHNTQTDIFDLLEGE